MCYYTSEVACPYFYPLQPEGGWTPLSLSGASARQDAMLPLGGPWRGMCRADPEGAAEPEENMRPVCNLGYARGVCRHFPPGDGPDAVRFTVTGDAGGRVGLYYVLERDHHPFAHGRLEYARDNGAIVTPAERRDDRIADPLNEARPPEAACRPAEGSTGETLARQAQAYAESYRRRKQL